MSTKQHSILESIIGMIVWRTKSSKCQLEQSHSKSAEAHNGTLARGAQLFKIELNYAKQGVRDSFS